MISDSELARELFTGTDKVVGELVKSGVVTTTIEATAVSDSVDGYVLVDMGGDTVTGEGPADQSADTDEDMASSDTPVASDENMSPCINMASTDSEYWSQVSEGLTITPVDDGWARVAYDNTEGESAVTLDAWQNPLDAVEEGETYTLLVEIRPVLPETEGSEEEDTPESHDPDDVPEDQEDGYGADDATPESGDDTEGEDTAEVTSSISPTTATSQLGASDPYRMAAGETRLTLTGQAGTTLLGTQFVVDAGKAMEADVRMSLYFGEYEGEYVPYGLLEGGAWQLVPTSSAVKAGDTVTISLVGGSMVDSRAVGSGDRISATAEQAKTLAEQAEQIASAIGQFAWNDNAGTHVSTEEAVAEGTRNILLNSYGILLRAAANYLAALTQSGIAFYDGTGNLADNIVASFGSSGAQIGKDGNKHTVIDSEGFSVYDGQGRLLSIIDELGWDRYQPVEPDHEGVANPGYDPDNPSTYESHIGLYANELSNIRDKVTFGDTSSRYVWNPREGASGGWAPVTSRLVDVEAVANQGATLSLKAIDSDSQGAIDIHSDNTVDVTGDIYLPNAKSIFGTDTNGNAVEALKAVNTYNETILGYGGYAASQGSTSIFGNNINLTPRSQNTFNGTNVMNTCGAYTNDNVYRNIWHMSNGQHLVIGYGWYLSSQRAYNTELQGNNLKLTYASAFTVNNIDYTDSSWTTPATGIHYKKRAGWVCIVFDGFSWTGTGDSTKFTLPSGYRPSYKINMLSVNGSNANLYVAVETGGAVKLHRASGASSYFNCAITFPVA